MRRLRERASRDRRLIDAVLDEGLLCHVGFDAGRGTVVLPMAYGRLGDALYLHGALGNDMLSALGGGLEACLSVTLLDGLVLARSQFHHSVNYRSVVLFGRAVAVTDDDERRRALEAIVDHVAPGRAGEARPPDPGELRRTRVVRFPIEEGSAKVRAGGPVEEEADLSLDVWAGVLPLRLETDDPVTDPAVS